LVYTGAIDDNYQDASAVSINYIDAAIGSYSSGQEVKQEKTKAIGCTIKWKG
jgi:hypothetical protein